LQVVLGAQFVEDFIQTSVVSLNLDCISAPGDPHLSRYRGGKRQRERNERKGKYPAAKRYMEHGGLGAHISATRAAAPLWADVQDRVGIRNAPDQIERAVALTEFSAIASLNTARA
jgi:hypothetical protein